MSVSQDVVRSFQDGHWLCFDRVLPSAREINMTPGYQKTGIRKAEQLLLATSIDVGLFRDASLYLSYKMCPPGS